MIRFDQLINTIHGAILSANDAMRKENLKILDTYFEKSNEEDEKSKEQNKLKPKTVTLQFPEQTSNGVKMKNVQVPLITLVPVNGTQISEVKFQTDLEIMVEKEQLLVNFPSSKAIKNQNDHKNVTSLEITISPQQTSEGLKKLIESYEKVLRSQLPN